MKAHALAILGSTLAGALTLGAQSGPSSIGCEVSVPTHRAFAPAAGATPTSVARFAEVHESFDSSGYPFDLGGGFLVFTPNATGGYDIRYVPGP